jgi:hemerythrin-like domain-containing protein
MSSRNPFSTLYESMLYFHSTHHQQLVSMQQQCKQAKNVRDLHRLASDIHSFCGFLHAHHTIEDKHLFPSIGRKIDISHLEAHHEQLAQLLVKFEDCSNRLKQLKNSDEDISTVITDTSSLVNKVSTLVNEHERAEEQIIAPDNMKKWFTESEMKQFFSM